MSIDAQTVRRVARLARLEVTEAELPGLALQMGRILDLMAELGRLETDAVPPLSHPMALSIPEREDRVENGDQREALLASAPDQEQGHFRVPRIIE
ncbi:MAG: Asp-tRNA(Asn)/Glu-tRNA(Gln) amidotransferase subunit GatC [Magnetococcales bacterium]|nr:Asp-tRNA(Asn)/Glu-tRNA(Gln) amidotransferase subunit GatC [Magnetococcales bacterium]